MINLKNIDYNLKELRRIAAKINALDFSGLGTDLLREKTASLRERAALGEAEAQLLPEAFALVSEAVKRTLQITPHDNQLMAAAAMVEGRIIELATGEGKTLCAVFTAFLKALPGKGVHVLTFNDYLAKRDALWMGPVYELLGFSALYITGDTPPEERRAAYAADVTYVTAKEAGFDYLRTFLAFEPEELVLRSFHAAIVDEADSLLIDEARIPLVIAGDTPAKTDIDEKLYRLTADMQKGVHFDTDEHDSGIYLEERGIAFLEERLGIKNLYSEAYSGLLEKINTVLQARYLLHRDVDYIVKDGEIKLVDAFTGRIAVNRQWSEGLHSAVEIKEGLTPKRKGQVMNSITLQNFLRLYPELCGMTGTARPAAAELLRFYEKSVTVIPPHVPCIRFDRPDVIFTDQKAKRQAVAEEIIKAHRAGRPVLVGTASIEESELLAGMLRAEIPGLAVLNAKKDEAEAAVIAGAGALGAVTISTNMAGRGVDIKLGGGNTTDYEKVCALGGLYVIGTNRHESTRVDDQLRGRAGRQGDPGESRFFISLEDGLIVRYGLYDSLPAEYKELKQDSPLDKPIIMRAINHTQKVVEGQLFDAKVTLFKYAALVEDQRLLVHAKREKLLRGEACLGILEQDAPDRYEALRRLVSEEEFLRAQRRIELYALGKCWADHLLFTDSLQDEVQMVGKVRGDPLTHYNTKLIEGFESMQEAIRETVLDIFGRVKVKDGRLDLDEMGIKGPTSTQTYMVHDGTETQGMLGALGDFAAAFSAPLYLLGVLAEKMKKRK
jgi:preprotein translocase subunit SecA